MSFYLRCARRLSVTRSRGFAQLWERVKRTRERPEFPFLRATLPRLRSDASESERLEHWLLTLDDEQYDTLSTEPSVVLRDDAPSTTGDAVADQWERQFWASQRGG